jgi:hypothetical protein
MYSASKGLVLRGFATAVSYFATRGLQIWCLENRMASYELSAVTRRAPHGEICTAAGRCIA